MNQLIMPLKINKPSVPIHKKTKEVVTTDVNLNKNLGGGPPLHMNLATMKNVSKGKGCGCGK